MKKWILAALAALLVWNIVLTYLVIDKPVRQGDDSDVTENVVIDYSNDLSEMAEAVRSSIVTVTTYVSGLRHTASGIVFARDEESVYVFTTELSGTDEGEITVTFDSAAEAEAEIVASDAACGISLLKIDPPFEVTLMRTGSSSLIRSGEYAAAIGGRSPISGSAPMSFGIISRPAQRRIAAGSSWFAASIDTDANVTSEMLGGPLLNIGGQLIGMLVSRTSGGDRMASALSVNEMKILYDEFMEQGEAVRGTLALTARSVSSMRAYEKSERNIKLNVTSGVLVTYIAENSPAQEILEEGDILSEMDGVEITDEDTLRQMLYEHNPGDEVVLSIIRNSEAMEVSVVLE